MLARTPKPVSSRTMQAIARAVESLPPFPLSAPLPLIGTDNEYSDKPCSTPRRRYMPSNTCHCGFLLGEHSRVVEFPDPAVDERVGSGGL